MTQGKVTQMLLRQLFADINERGCIVVPIRFKPIADEDLFLGDYDFAICPTDTSEILRAIRERLTSQGIDFAIYRRKPAKIRIAILSDDQSQQLILEFWQELETRSLRSTYPSIQWEDLKEHIQADSGSITGYRINPDIEAAYYLCHLQEKHKRLDQGMVPIRLGRYLESKELPQDITALISALKSDQSIPGVASAAADYLVRKGVLRSIKRGNDVLKVWQSRLHESLFRLRLSMASWHRFVDFIGPDGVGKTSLIEAASGQTFRSGKYFRFKKTYRKSITYSLVHPILKRIYQRREKQKLAKNQIDDMSSGLLFYISVAGIFWRNIVSLLVGRIYLSDRSPADLLISGYRFQDSQITLRKSALRDIRFMPTPRAVVHLHAPAEVITARKQEMNEAQIRKYQSSMFDVYLIKTPPIYVSINTNCPIEHSLSSLSRLMKKDSKG